MLPSNTRLEQLGHRDEYAGFHDAAARALHGTPQRERVEAGGQRAARRRGGEHGDAAGEDALVAEARGAGAAQQRGQRAGEQIRGERPGVVIEAAQVARDFRHGRAHDGGVERRHEQAQGQPRQHRAGGEGFGAAFLGCSLAGFEPLCPQFPCIHVFLLS
jgi:hypothetical protein